MIYTLSDYENAGCSFKKDMDNSSSIVQFKHLVEATNGNVCKGCYDYDSGKCPGMNALTVKARTYHATKHVLTNAEIAAKLHCSKRQVAKMRKDGTLATALKGINHE